MKNFKAKISFSNALKSFTDEKFSVVIDVSNLGDSDRRKVMLAVDHWIKTFNSPEFETFIKNYTWTETTCKGWFRWKTCQSFIRQTFTFAENYLRGEVYDILIGGKEALGDGSIDHTAQVYLKIDERNRRGIVGYTTADTKWQWIYRWAFDSFTIEEIANNLAHEYCHKCGFEDSSYALSRHAVTYAVGEFVGNFRD